MLIKRWNKLPEKMQNIEIRPYFDILRKQNISLIFKRIFDIIFSLNLILLLLAVFLILSLMIKVDSKGPIFFRQERITQYGKKFKIIKFRTMYVNNTNQSLVTLNNDSRITKVGRLIRKCRLDEFPQLFNILCGTMSFVGTRPEVLKYVDHYTNEMNATLLLPAGVTSIASIVFKDEAAFLDGKKDSDQVYINEILPQKMEWNLYSVKHFSLLHDFKIMFYTILAVLGKNVTEDKLK